MELTLQELAGVSGIYKLNFPNGKIYIGYSCDIRRRMWEHNDPKKGKALCDKAINKYGKFDKVEILEFLPGATPDILKEREAYWISYYNATNKEIGYNLMANGDGSGKPNEESPNAVFSNAQVLDIRKRRYLGERKKDVYKDYENFSFSTFEHVWLGRGYPNVGQEYIIKPYTKSRAEYSSEANRGVKNGRAKCTEEEVKEIRRLYDEEKLSFGQIAQRFPQISKSSARRIALRETYKDIK